jgi:CRISPR system Cascade subunit CasD
MSTLLLRLSGPMQSWGVQSRFVMRDTGLEPSKSGVIGLVCAALGRPRDAAVDDLAILRMGVRVDREGVMQTDYHTAGGSHRRDETGYGVARFGGAKPETVQSWRRYLADAAFLVGLETRADEDESLLRRLDAALAQPVWPLYLGRKAFVPGEPVRLPDEPLLWGAGPRIVSHELREALTLCWPQRQEGDRTDSPDRLRGVVEDPNGDQTRMDVPVSFVPLDRRYLSRTVKTEWIERLAIAQAPPDPLNISRNQIEGDDR